MLLHSNAVATGSISLPFRQVPKQALQPGKQRVDMDVHPSSCPDPIAAMSYSCASSADAEFFRDFGLPPILARPTLDNCEEVEDSVCSQICSCKA